jgi:hypothetical protein
LLVVGCHLVALHPAYQAIRVQGAVELPGWSDPVI